MTKEELDAFFDRLTTFITTSPLYDEDRRESALKIIAAHREMPAFMTLHTWWLLLPEGSEVQHSIYLDGSVPVHDVSVDVYRPDRRFSIGYGDAANFLTSMIEALTQLLDALTE